MGYAGAFFMVYEVEIQIKILLKREGQCLRNFIHLGNIKLW